MHEHSDHSDNAGKSWWTTPTGIACLFFMAAAGYFLFMEHRAHIVPFLPYLIILLCPLMHLFHHGRHGGHHNEDHEQADDRLSRQETGDIQKTDRKDDQNQRKHGGC